MSNDNSVSEIETSYREPKQHFPTYKASKFIWLLLYVVEILIVLRIMLDMMGANPDNPIVTLIYGFTSVILAPFAGLIGSTTIGGKVLEVSSLFAMGIYALFAVAMERLVWLIFYRSHNSVADVTETTSSASHINP